MPTEINIKPETKRNFRLGVSLEDSFRCGSSSLGGLSELLCLKVFWDIPGQITAAKVKNLTGFIGYRLTMLWCVIFFLAFFTSIEAQNFTKSPHFHFKIRTLGAMMDLPSEEISSSRQYQARVRKEMNRWHNQGYPFALLRFDTVLSSAGDLGRVVATLDIGPLISNGRIVNHGDTSIPDGFLKKALGFRTDQPFSTSRFNAIPSLLRQMTYIEQISLPRLEWFGDKAVLHVSLQKKRLNTFSGLLGILPQPEGKGGTLVTGNIDLGLANLFSRGVGISLAWSRFAPSAQTADIKASIPAIGYNGFGLATSFNLFRQDSLLTKQRFEFQTVSNLSGDWKYKMGVVVARASSGIQSSDSSFRNIRINALSFSISWAMLVPQGIVFKKRQFAVSVYPAIKSIDRKNDSRQLPQLEAGFQASWFVPTVSKRFGIQVNSSASGIWSDVITLADQARMGGFKTIRGFNENFFFTSQNVLLSVQPQFLLDQNLMVGIFADGMLYNPNMDMKGFAAPDLAFSSGVALEIALNKNLVQVAFGNGTAPGIPVDLRATKIHFGYVASF